MKQIVIQLLVWLTVLTLLITVAYTARGMSARWLQQTLYTTNATPALAGPTDGGSGGG